MIYFCSSGGICFWFINIWSPSFLPLIKTNTQLSWWVLYEIWYCRKREKLVPFLIFFYFKFSKSITCTHNAWQNWAVFILTGFPWDKNFWKWNKYLSIEQMFARCHSHPVNCIYIYTLPPKHGFTLLLTVCLPFNL